MMGRYLITDSASAGLCSKLGFSDLTTNRFQTEAGEKIISIENILWCDIYFDPQR